jgi:hypothetical protein
MNDDAKTESDAVTLQTKVSGVVAKKKPGDHLSKYSGSRKSSIDTSNTANVKNAIRLENTYKLGPDENKRFYAYKIYSSILDLITEKISNSERANPSGYSPKISASLTRELADNIRREAKNLSVPRYKIVVHVVVGENSGQDARVASRCIFILKNHITLIFLFINN